MSYLTTLRVTLYDTEHNLNMVYCGSFYQYLQFLPLNRGHEVGHTANIHNSEEKSNSGFLCFLVNTLSPLPTQVLLGPMVPVWWGVSLRKKRTYSTWDQGTLPQSLLPLQSFLSALPFVEREGEYIFRKTEFTSRTAATYLRGGWHSGLCSFGRAEESKAGN